MPQRPHNRAPIHHIWQGTQPFGVRRPLVEYTGGTGIPQPQTMVYLGFENGCNSKSDKDFTAALQLEGRGFLRLEVFASRR